MGLTKEELTMDTYIRKMPHSAFVKLSILLDPDNFWEKFAKEIPLKLEMLGQHDAQPRYTHQQMETFALHGGKPGCSPTKRVLQDWGTKNARIHHLITVLTSAQLYAAADYLHKDLLKLGPAPRPGEGETYQDSSNKENTYSCSSVSASDNASWVSSFSDNVCIETPSKPIEGKKDIGSLVAHPCHLAVNIEEQPSSAWFGSVQSDRLSCVSSAASAMNEQGISLSQLQRELSISDEGNATEVWLGLEDIEIQTITYPMLWAITNNFNNQPLENGGNKIGSGGFGVVYLGQFHNGFKIAVKCLRESGQLKEEDLLKQFETEIKMLSKYRHENILHLLGYSTDGPTPCLVYQYLPNGSLEDRLACLHQTPPLSANMRLKIIKGTANGIAYLNEKKYVHRDIKSANILLDSEFTAKVGDFATVRQAPSGSDKSIACANTSVVIGTPVYLAPEAISFDVSTKLDAYSFGVVLLEVITGLPAFDIDREERNLPSHVMEEVDVPSDILNFVDPKAGEWGPGTVEAIYDIACRCLEHRKKIRPNITDIKPEIDQLTN